VPYPVHYQANANYAVSVIQKMQTAVIYRLPNHCRVQALRDANQERQESPQNSSTAHILQW